MGGCSLGPSCWATDDLDRAKKEYDYMVNELLFDSEEIEIRILVSGADIVRINNILAGAITGYVIECNCSPVCDGTCTRGVLTALQKEFWEAQCYVRRDP